MSSYSNSRLAMLNWGELDGASVVATSEVGDFIDDHLLDADPDLSWRSSSTAAQTLTITLDRIRPVDCIGLCAHNLSVGATIEITYKDGSTVLAVDAVDAHRPLYGAFQAPGAFLIGAFGVPDPNDQIEFLYPYTDVWRDSLVFPDTLEIVITDTSNPDGFIEIGYLFIAQSFAPEHNRGWDYEAGFLAASTVSDRPDGATIVEYDHPKRTARIQWEWLSTAELIRINQLLLQVQLREGVMLWTGYPGQGGAWEDQHVMLAYPVEWSSPQQVAAKGFWELILKEVYFHA